MGGVQNLNERQWRRGATVRISSVFLEKCPWNHLPKKLQNITRTVFSEENVCPPTSLNRHIVKIDCIYNKLKVTIYLYVSLVKIHPFLNEIGCGQAIF